MNDAAIHLTYGTYPTGLPRGLRPLAMTVDVYGYDTYFCHAELVSASGRHYVLSVTLDRSRNEFGMTIGTCPQYLIGRIRYSPPPPVLIITLLSFFIFLSFPSLLPYCIIYYVIFFQFSQDRNTGLIYFSTRRNSRFQGVQKICPWFPAPAREPILHQGTAPLQAVQKVRSGARNTFYND